MFRHQGDQSEWCERGWLVSWHISVSPSEHPWRKVKYMKSSYCKRCCNAMFTYDKCKWFTEKLTHNTKFYVCLKKFGRNQVFVILKVKSIWVFTGMPRILYPARHRHLPVHRLHAPPCPQVWSKARASLCGAGRCEPRHRTWPGPRWCPEPGGDPPRPASWWRPPPAPRGRSWWRPPAGCTPLSWSVSHHSGSQAVTL